jgi:putative hydrolase of the HAD superfamily
MRPARALCFDLDNTLLDSSLYRESVVGTCERLAATHSALDVGRLLDANGRAWQGYWPVIEEDWNLGVIDGAGVKREMWRRTLIACDCDDESLLRIACETHSVLEHESHRLFDDVREVLARVKRARIPLALITNGAGDTQRAKLCALGLEDAFDAVVVSGEVRAAKPDPRVFAVALRQLSVEAQDVWHVGDNPETDVAGAKAAGLTAVWLNRRRRPLGDTEPPPDLEIHSLSGLAESLLRRA